MSVEKLKQIITSCVNDIVFLLEGKQCGVTSQVKDYSPTYQCWCGDKTQEYDDIDVLLEDRFFDGRNLKDLILNVEILIV